MQVKLTKNAKQYNEFRLDMKLTAGQVLAIRHALVTYAEHSAVASDVLDGLNAVQAEAKLIGPDGLPLW